MTKRTKRPFTRIDVVPSKLKMAAPIHHGRGEFITVHHSRTDRDELLHRLQIHHKDRQAA